MQSRALFYHKPHARFIRYCLLVIYRYYAATVALFVKSTRYFFFCRNILSLGFHQRYSHTVAAMFELLNCSMQTKARAARKNHVCYIKLPTSSYRLPPLPLKIALCVCLFNSEFIYIKLDECKILNSRSRIALVIFFVVKSRNSLLDDNFRFSLSKRVFSIINVINWPKRLREDVKNINMRACI